MLSTTFDRRLDIKPSLSSKTLKLIWWQQGQIC